MICIPDSAGCFDLDSLLSHLPVRSPYGISEKQTLNFCVPGDEDYLRLEFARVADVMQDIVNKSYWVWELEGFLSKLPQIGNIIEASSQNTVLSLTQIADIMETCSLVMKIRELTDSMPRSIVPLAAPKLSGSLTKLLNLAGDIFPDGTPRLEGVAGHSYREKIDDLQKVIKAIRDEYITCVKMTEESTGLKVRPGGTIRVSRLDESLIDYLDRTALVERHQESLDYIVFIMRKSEKWQELGEQVKELRISISQYGEECRSEFSQLVGESSAEYERILSELGHLDLIIAKARFGTEFGGICPEITDEPHVWLIGGEDLKQFVRSPDAPVFNCKITSGITVVTGGQDSRRPELMFLLARLLFWAHLGIPVPAAKMQTGLHHFICYLRGFDLCDEKQLARSMEEFDSVSTYEGRGVFLFDEPAGNFPGGFASTFSLALLKRVRFERDMVVLATEDSLILSRYGKEACLFIEASDDESDNKKSNPRRTIVSWDEYKSENAMIDALRKSALGEEFEEILGELWE